MPAIYGTVARKSVAGKRFAECQPTVGVPVYSGLEMGVAFPSVWRGLSPTQFATWIEFQRRQVVEAKPHVAWTGTVVALISW